MITYDQIAALDPCWLRDGRDEELRRRVGDGVTAMRIATAADVSINDRRWLLTNLLARGPRPDLRALVRWACSCALDAVDAVDTIRDWHIEGATRSLIETTLRWCDGDATIEEVWRDRDAAAAAAYAYADAAAAAAAAAAADAAAAAYAYAYAYAAAASAAAASAAAAYADAAAYAGGDRRPEPVLAARRPRRHLRQLAQIIDGGSL